MREADAESMKTDFFLLFFSFFQTIVLNVREETESYPLY